MAEITDGEMEEHFKVHANLHFSTFFSQEYSVLLLLQPPLQCSGANPEWLSETGMESLLHCEDEEMARWGVILIIIHFIPITIIS